MKKRVVLWEVEASQGWCEPDMEQRMKRTFEMFA
jgi:hypothetical protein